MFLRPTWLCSGVALSSALRNHSQPVLGENTGSRGANPGQPQAIAFTCFTFSTAPTCLVLYPLSLSCCCLQLDLFIVYLVYSLAISFCFFSFFCDIFFFYITSFSGLGTIHSSLMRIISVWPELICLWVNRLMILVKFCGASWVLCSPANHHLNL